MLVLVCVCVSWRLCVSARDRQEQVDKKNKVRKPCCVSVSGFEAPEHCVRRPVPVREASLACLGGSALSVSASTPTYKLM